ncbi:hypothetical protein EC957_005529 [Mortierella hygrophila]|uniref:Uncharacterized protein n=1 Tax=Mortierella hygrophila TaxID=979708 RepID=A0A9P6JZ57_9FUNG|nr:hypothetical protein EC957_005529 [Mortierella hygrophila]
MAHKRRRLEEKGWDPATIALVLDSRKEKRKQKGYNNIQQRYISWAKSRGVDPEQPNPAQLLNWLTAGVLIQEWHASTVQNYKSAIIYMYEDKSSFSDLNFLSYFKVIKERSVKDMKEIDIGLQPILTHFRQQGPNETLDISALTRKLCWLIGTCGFLRPSDIWCIDLANDNFALSEDLCKLPIVFPKETRDGQRIIKYTTIKSHEDPLLCPVRTITEYLRRLEGHEIMVPHHKDESVLHRPLIRDVRLPRTPVTSQTIGNHIAAITDLLGLPPTRATGPTEAIKKGALVDNVVVHGNWSSSMIVNNYYRLTRATATNFTSLVLP